MDIPLDRYLDPSPRGQTDTCENVTFAIKSEDGKKIYIFDLYKCSFYSMVLQRKVCSHSDLSWYQGCARFPDFVNNSCERQILWSLCSVDFQTLTLQLPIQTPHSVAPELQVFVSSLQNCQNFSKTSTPLSNFILDFIIKSVSLCYFFIRLGT